MRDPTVEVRLRDGERLEAHVRVARTAVLDTGAIEGVGRRRVRGIPQIIRVVADDVALAR